MPVVNSSNPSLLEKTITVWNHNLKLRSKGFSTILKASEVEGISPGDTITVIGRSKEKDGKVKTVKMQCEVVCAVVEPFLVICQNTWLVHEFIGKTGEEAERFMQHVFPNVSPSEKMISIRLQFLKILK